MYGKRRLTAVGLGLGLALAGCGADDGSGVTPVTTGSSTTSEGAGTTPSPSSPPSPTTPASSPTERVPADAAACSDVWQDGAKLPRTYAGCVSEGEYLKRDVLGCSSGQRLVRFDEAFYAVLGGTITAAETSPLLKDRDYRDVVVACRA